MKQGLFYCIVFMIGSVLAADLSYNDPKKLDTWEKFRRQVVHPAGIYTVSDVERAREKITKYEWAATLAQKEIDAGEAALQLITPEYIEEYISHITPIALYGPCPACRDKGLRWHPNGTWARGDNDNQLKCVTCGTIFPNEKYPETIEITSKWDPAQKFSFCGGEYFLGHAEKKVRPSFSGMIRSIKLHIALKQLNSLAFAYAFTLNPKYAEGARSILLRCAQVFPKYLFNTALYSEIADCDPHQASENPYMLLADEITVPPNEPDKSVFSGYWCGSRLGTAGQDGKAWVIDLATAYDLTCDARRTDGTPVFSEAEKKLIEKDVLYEMCYQFLCNKNIDNKAVGNRAATAVVGKIIGHPDMVRYGLEGFIKAVNSWFLPDGGTSESAAYGMMTMENIQAFPFLFRDYSDPEGYIPPDGKSRLEHFNACRDTGYGLCWQNLVLTLQGNLRHPPLADSYQNTAIDGESCDLLALCLPNSFNLSFFNANNNGKIFNGRNALLFDAAMKTEENPAFALPDIVFPYLSQGFFRYGKNGLEATAVIDASNWGAHHHLDSLNLVLWHEDELLNDLGYLWDHVDKHMTARTLAHNLVLVDNADQHDNGRNGSFTLFEKTDNVKAMRASSNAYGKGGIYERILLQIDHGAKGFYWLDLFRANQGKYRNYVFHGVNNDYSVSGAVFGNASGRDDLRFGIKLYLNKLGTMELRDAEVVEIDENDKVISQNIAVPFPENAPNLRAIDGWGMYVGNGTAKWEAVKAEDGAVIVRYSALSKEDRPNMQVNHALVIGGTDGLTGEKGFVGHPGARYRVRFKAKGSKNTIMPLVVSFGVAQEDNPGSRTYSAITMEKKELTTEWQEFEGIFAIPWASQTNTGSRRAGRIVADDSRNSWNITWKIKDGHEFTAFVPFVEEEQFAIADDWGQRDYKNTDRGVTLPYIIRKRGGAKTDSFVTCFNSYFNGERLVNDVAVSETQDGVLVTVRTNDGDDIIMFAKDGRMIRSGKLESDASIAVFTGGDNNGMPRHATMFEGRRLKSGNLLSDGAKREFSGFIVDAVHEKHDSFFVITGRNIEEAELEGHTMIVTGNDGISHAYPILKAIKNAGMAEVYVQLDGYGFPAIKSNVWKVPNVVSLDVIQ